MPKLGGVGTRRPTQLFHFPPSTPAAYGGSVASTFRNPLPVEVGNVASYRLYPAGTPLVLVDSRGVMLFENPPLRLVADFTA